MKNIDERIVQMKFDNKHFEDNIGTSMKSIEKLKQGLNFDESVKSFTTLQGVAGKFSLGGIANGVDTIAHKFNALSIIGITTLANLTNAAIHAGETIISSLTVSPIKMGLNEYETKMGSIQTILTNTADKGTKLADVTKALNELNEYSDQTIYNFAEMTRNIGTFTAAGVDLNTSVMSIKGIANLAAGSGSSALQASTAMYQLSQALAAGSVKLQDWNSVVNAGMGGQLFQKALEKTAKELGHGRDMSVSFRESLQDGWITTEVLTKTLQKFAKDESLIKAATQVKTFTQLFDTMRESVQSGWAVSWEAIIGDKDEATAMLTNINNAFGAIAGKSADARNEMLSFWNANGGRDAMIKAIANAFQWLGSVLKPIGTAFREIFPRTTGQKLVDMSNAVLKLTENFKMGDKTAENLKMTFKGFFAVLDIGAKGLKVLAGLAGLLIRSVLPVADPILYVTGTLGKFLVALNEAIEANTLISFSVDKMGIAFTVTKNLISQAITTITPLISKVKTITMEFVTFLKEMFGGKVVFAQTLNDTSNAMITVEEKTNRVGVAMEKIHSIFEKVKTTLVNTTAILKAKLSPVFDAILKKFNEMTMQDFGAILTGVGFIKFAKVIENISKSTSNLDKITSSFSKVLGEVGNTLKAFQLQVKAGALLKIAIAIGILALALVALSTIKVEDIKKSLGLLTAIIIELVAAMAIIGKTVRGVNKINGQLIAIGIGLMLLSFSVKILSSIDPAKIDQGVKAMAILAAGIAVFINVTRRGNLKQSAKGLIGFSIGIMLLSASLVALGNIDPVKLQQGTKAIADIMAVLAVFIGVTKKGDLKKSASGMIGFSIGLLILTSALVILGNLDEAKVKQGTIAIVLLMTTLAAFINLVKERDLKATAGGLVGFSIGILILTGALAILAEMDQNKLIQGGIAIAGLMMVIAAFVDSTKEGDLRKSAGGLIAFSVGILILTGALAILGKIDTDKLNQGAIAIIVMMAAIAVFIKGTEEGDLKKSAGGLIAFSVGLVVLTQAVKILSDIDPTRIEGAVKALGIMIMGIAMFIRNTDYKDLTASSKGLIQFSIGLIALSLAVKVLASIDPNRIVQGVVALVALMTAIGAFVSLTKEGDLAKSGKGLMAFSTGIAILAGSIAILSALNPEKLMLASVALSVLMVAIGTFLQATNGKDLMITSVGLVIFSGAIFVLAKALAVIGSMDVKTLAVGIGAITLAFASLALGMFLLSPLVPVITSLTIAIAIFGAGCALVGAGMLAFGAGMKLLAESGTAGAEALKAAFAAIISLIPLAMTTLALGIIEFAKTIGDGAIVVAEAFMKVFTAILDTVVIMTPKLVEAGMKLILGILTGIANNIQKIVEAAADIIIRFNTGISNKLPSIIDSAFKVIISFINGLANAIRNNHDSINAAARNLVNALVEAIFDLMPTLTNIGVDIIRGIIKGIGSMRARLKESMENIATGAVDGLKRLLGIHSPSRVFAEIGKFSMMGFANGLDKFSSLSSASAINAGNNAMNSLTSAMANISDIVSGEMDMNPTIRPVLDLSDVQNGSKQLYGMMNQHDGYTINGSVNKANRVSGSMRYNNQADSSTPATNNTQTQSISQSNTFHITSNNPKEVAEEVSRILQKQVERRDLVWA